MRFDPSDHSTASEAQVAADAQARKAAVDNGPRPGKLSERATRQGACGGQGITLTLM